jgi:hypothetical protein
MDSSSSLFNRLLWIRRSRHLSRHIHWLNQIILSPISYALKLSSSTGLSAFSILEKFLNDVNCGYYHIWYRGLSISMLQVNRTQPWKLWAAGGHVWGYGKVLVHLKTWVDDNIAWIIDKSNLCIIIKCCTNMAWLGWYHLLWNGHTAGQNVHP